MRPWSEGDIDVEGLRLHYTRTGRDGDNGDRGTDTATWPARPALVLAHGVADDGLCWTPVARALEADYNLIMVDARGHGRSDAPPHGYGPAQQAADLRGVIAGLGLRRPVLVGHSLGAVTVLALAGLHPAAPAALVLEDPPPLWMAHTQGPPDAARVAAQRAWLAGLARAPRAELIAAQRARAPHWAADELGPWADAKRRVSPRVGAVFGAEAATGLDWAEVLRRVACPVLLLTANPARGRCSRRTASPRCGRWRRRCGPYPSPRQATTSAAINASGIWRSCARSCGR